MHENQLKKVYLAKPRFTSLPEILIVLILTINMLPGFVSLKSWRIFNNVFTARISMFSLCYHARPSAISTTFTTATLRITDVSFHFSQHLWNLRRFASKKAHKNTAFYLMDSIRNSWSDFLLLYAIVYSLLDFCDAFFERRLRKHFPLESILAVADH